MEGFIPVIGIEIHVELKTGSKAFCSCSAGYGGEPNTRCCPVCLGMPGALPMLNGEAVRLSALASVATGCTVAKRFHFDRKNYFYPDLPKGYQITQRDTPIGRDGAVRITADGAEKDIRIERIQLEEDAGKLIHRPEDGLTLIDFNRCGVPLIEIVSGPDMRSAAEAVAYVCEIRRVMRFYGISDCKMNEGSLRCDVNVSVMREGSGVPGTRCEIKNINSLNFTAKAIEAEFERQCGIISRGGTVIMETRRFNEDTGKTERMRDKETALDYRFIREADIPDVTLDDSYIDELRRETGRTPARRMREWRDRWGVREDDASLICFSREMADYFERAAVGCADPRVLTSLTVGTVIPEYGDAPTFPPEYLSRAADLFASGKVTSTAVKKLIKIMGDTGLDPDAAAEKNGLLTLTDREEIRALVRRAAENDPRSAADVRRGKTKAKAAIVGGVMRLSRGAADPRIAAEEVDVFFAEDGD